MFSPAFKKHYRKCFLFKYLQPDCHQSWCKLHWHDLCICFESALSVQTYQRLIWDFSSTFDLNPRLYCRTIPFLKKNSFRMRDNCVRLYIQMCVIHASMGVSFFLCIYCFYLWFAYLRTVSFRKSHRIQIIEIIYLII